MAGIVSSMAENFLAKLSEKAYQETCLALGVQRDLKKLKHTMSMVEAVLLDAEEKQLKGDKPVNIWLDDLKDLFYDAEDVFDEFECEALRKQVVKKKGTTLKVRRFFSASNPALFSLKMAHKIREIRERFDEVGAVSEKLGLTKRVENSKHVLPTKSYEMPHSYVDAPDVIGRDKDKQRIISLLTSSEEEGGKENLSVIPIVGIGGMGKTTLAKAVYNDKKVIDHFQKRMWVMVSVDFDVERLTKHILSSAMGKAIEDLTPDQMQAKLREEIKGKRFLLLLDNVWQDDVKKWWELRQFLTGGAQGSKIIVTTRQKLVAEQMGSVTPYNLEGLSEKDSRSLFVKFAFKDGQDPPSDLKSIGEEILAKCARVPLAIKTLGSLLRSKSSRKEWEMIRDKDVFWQEEDRENDILPALRLSYNLMPSYLKPCFLYFSLFPKNFTFHDLSMIQYWMAQGLLRSPNDNDQDLEDIGNLYFNEFMSRSFFQDVKECFAGGYLFQMHDLLHDLALLVAKREFVLIKSNTRNIPESIRHVSFSLYDYNEIIPLVRTISNTTTRVRSIIAMPLEVSEEVARKKSSKIPLAKPFEEMDISKFKYLRCLDLSGSSSESLPSHFGSRVVKHLRYLDLSGNKMIRLPNAICELQSLQALRLEDCTELQELPKDILNLISLRFLDFTTKQTYLPENGVGCLTSLRTLGIFNCKTLKALCNDLGNLKALRVLTIYGCNSLKSLPHGIRYLNALETLEIKACKNLKVTDREENEEEEEGNVQAKKKTLRLRELSFDNVGELEALPQWLKHAGPTLQVIKIKSCHKFRRLPSWLPVLTSLEHLWLEHCPGLLSFPDGIKNLSLLKRLKVGNCGRLSERCMPEIGVDWQKIAHVRDVSVW